MNKLELISTLLLPYNKSIIQTLFETEMSRLSNRFNNFWEFVETLPIGYNNPTSIKYSDNVPLKIIGITGQKYNGKDTISDYLVNKYGYIKLAFADILKDICGILFNFTYEQLYGELKETPDVNIFGFTPRQMMQYIGTEIFRKYDKNVWVNCVSKLFETCSGKFVISDVRFQNELDMIKGYDGLIIRIIRPNILSTDLHSSETDIGNFIVDEEIMNDSTIESLYEKIDIIMSKTTF